MKECIHGTHVCGGCNVTAWFCYTSAFVMYLFISSWDIFTLSGKAYFDLAFIDHSDNYNECDFLFESDIYHTVYNPLNANVSICEEKQFQTEVLKAEWLWNFHKFYSAYCMNFTNAAEFSGASSASSITLQELSPIFLASAGGEVKVDKQQIDENGILSYSLSRSWLIDTTRSYHSQGVMDFILVPQVIFATIILNKIKIENVNGALNKAYPSYYPLFARVRLSNYVFEGFTRESEDYVSQIQSDIPFSVGMYRMEQLSTSFFTSQRDGLQGFGFIYTTWNDVQHHCGYDRDCIPKTRNDIIKWSSQSASEASNACASLKGLQFCNPTTLKQAANGVARGVSSLRSLPSGTFWEIEEVSGGDHAMWDFKTISTVGTKWLGLNRAFFFLHDVTLSNDQSHVTRILADQWILTSYHSRQESCESAGGSSDTRGIDCTSEPGTINIGFALDPTFPAPLFISPPDFASSTSSTVNLHHCNTLPYPVKRECIRPLANPFEIFTHSVTGEKICFRESWQINLKLQKSETPTGNTEHLLPLYWQTEYSCRPIQPWLRLTFLDGYATQFLDSVVGWGILFLIFFPSLVVVIGLTLKWRRVDISRYSSDRACV